MKSKSFILFSAAIVVGGYVLSPAWAEDPQTKPALSASAASSDAVSAESVNAKKISTAIAGELEYRIGQNDLLEIRVFQADLFNRTVRVNSSGYISLPLIGLVEAAGLTALELERFIAARLEEKYMHGPEVSVFISEYTSQRVTIEGSVKNPGNYPLKGRTTLRQVLAMSAGTDGLADLSEIHVHRVVNGESKILVYNLEAIREGKEEDPVMRGNDIVLVDASFTQSVIKGVWRVLLEIATFGVYRP